MRLATSTDCYLPTRQGPRQETMNGKLAWANFVANGQRCHTWTSSTQRPDIATLSLHFWCRLAVARATHQTFFTTMLPFLGDILVLEFSAAGVSHGCGKVADAWLKLKPSKVWPRSTAVSASLLLPFSVCTNFRRRGAGAVACVIDGNQKLTGRTSVEPIAELKPLPGTKWHYLQDWYGAPMRKQLFCDEQAQRWLPRSL